MKNRNELTPSEMKWCEKAGESILNQFAPGKPLREFGIPPRIVELLTKYCNVFIVEDLLMLEPGDIDGLKLNDGDRNILECAIWEAATRK